MTKVEAVITKARADLISRGWTVTVTPAQYNPEHIHIELTRGSERKGWGCFPDLYCWSVAYESITGKDLLTLA